MNYLSELRRLQAARPVAMPPVVVPTSDSLVSAGAGHFTAAKESWPDPWRARRNPMIDKLSLPREWTAGLRRMAEILPPRSCAESRWEELAEDVDYIAEHWAEKAHRSGWSLLDLFGCSANLARRLDRDGLAALLRGRQISALKTSHASIDNPQSTASTYYRKSMDEAVLIWEA